MNKKTNTNPFAEALKAEDSKESVSVTENGALGYARTDSRLVDFFFKVGSMRSMSEDDIKAQFGEAYAEDAHRAIELMYFVRDCRGGVGEKRVFKVCFDWMVCNAPADAVYLLPLIPEYGSWKSFFELTDSFRKAAMVLDAAFDFVRKQWNSDIAKVDSDESVSLMAKWLPSENTSSKETVRLAKIWRTALGMDPRSYRKGLSMLRKKIRVVERDMTLGYWNRINYNAVPAKAGQIYKKAFLKHDEVRRTKWLEDLKAGKEGVKINTAGLTVADMVKEYRKGRGYGSSLKPEDPTIEAAWRDLVAKNMLPDTGKSLLPIVDGSGSMFAGIDRNSDLEAIDVSIGLGLFLANINTPEWRGMLIEFGSNPQFFTVPVNASLHDQIQICLRHDDCGSTNIQAVYNLILKTSVEHGFSQGQIPDLITFSDMEFDSAYGSRYSWSSWNRRSDESLSKLFDIITAEYKRHGYVLPRSVFWNINSRTGTIPLTTNEMGVALLSGFSQSIMDMVLSRKLDPLSVLLEKLDSPRYDLVRKALDDKKEDDKYPF